QGPVRMSLLSSTSISKGRSYCTVRPLVSAGTLVTYLGSTQGPYIPALSLRMDVAFRKHDEDHPRPHPLLHLVDRGALRTCLGSGAGAVLPGATDAGRLAGHAGAAGVPMV